MRKKKKPYSIKVRKKWIINPKTRVKKSAKIYSRKREKVKINKKIRQGMS